MYVSCSGSSVLITEFFNDFLYAWIKYRILDHMLKEWECVWPFGHSIVISFRNLILNKIKIFKKIVCSQLYHILFFSFYWKFDIFLLLMKMTYFLSMTQECINIIFKHDLILKLSTLKLSKNMIFYLYKFTMNYKIFSIY